MITKKLKNNFFNITVIVLAVCFLWLGIYFLLSNKVCTNQNESQSNAVATTKLYANGDTYNLTFNVDENFQSFSINDVVITPGVSQVLQFESGQFLGFNYVLKDGFVIKQFFSYNTDTAEKFTTVSMFGFTMPSFNLTLSITSAEVRNITINKINFDSVNQYNAEQFLYTPDYGSSLKIPMEADLNYEEYEKDGVKFKSRNNYQNITLEDGFLIISDIQNDDEIDVYFIKKSYACSISYFEAVDDLTSVGGTFDIENSDEIFNVQKTNKKITCNVILGSSITIKDILAKSGYKYVKVFVTDKNGHSEGVGFDITTNLEDGSVVVSNISTELLIYVQFAKTYEVSVVVNNLYIDGQSKKIGKVGFFEEGKDYNIDSRLFDGESVVTLSTKIDDDYAEKYEFKTWNITTPGGRPLNVEDHGLTNADLLHTQITFTNIDRNIKFEAVFGIKSFNVSVVWEGNGTVESTNIIGDNNYTYPVIYGEYIRLKFTPKNNMFFVKDPQLIKSVPSDDETQNIVTQTAKDGYLEYKIENILQNLQVKLSFVKNTWWEHIDTEELQGKGTEAEPYRIYTASDLAFISKSIYYGVSSGGAEYMEYSNAYYILMNDIDCGKDYYFMPLGIALDKTAYTVKNQFNGTFDYQYHTITNMWTEADITNYQHDGLFELLGPNANIINRYRDYRSLIFGIGGSLILLAVVVRIVFFVEKKRNKPKKIVTLSNYINHKIDE